MRTLELQSFANGHPAVVVEKERSGVSNHLSAEMIEAEELSTATASRAQQVFVLPTGKQAVRLTSLDPIQEWEGVVEWVRDGEFGARLHDLTDPGEDELTEFGVGEVSPDDLDLVRPGAVFYWTICREMNETRRLRHVTMLRFRRLPSVQAGRRPEVQREADWIADQLKLGSTDARSSGT